MSTRILFTLLLLICTAEVNSSGVVRKSWEWTPERRLQEELTDSERALCRGSDQSVRDFCDEWQSYWAEWDEAPSSTSLQQNCRIDNVTKEMHCRMSAFCEGGHLRESDLNFLSYPCGKNCKGSLLLDCCNKCQMYSANPKALHVNGIACTGCEPENIAKAIDEANCYFNENEFKCTTMDKCHLGSPSQFEKTCNIIPCDSCPSENLRGQCCQDCVGRQCKGTTGNTRLVCKGCDQEGSSSSSPFWMVLLVIFFFVSLAGMGWFVCKKLKSRPADSPADEEEEEEE